MNLRSYTTLSFVLCNLLVGADYTDWATTSFQGGDTVTINKDSQGQKVLNNSGISLTSGTLKVNVDASAISSACGIVACYNGGGPYTIGSQGSLIDFTITGNSGSSNRGGFEIRGPTVSFESNVSINTSSSNIQDAFQVADSTLTFDGDVTINAQGKRAINAGNGKVNLGQGGKKVNITGEMKFTNNSQAKIKLSSGSQIAGNINAESGANIKLEMLQGSTINGNFTGTPGRGAGTSLDLSNQGTFTGNITNEGTTKISLIQNGRIVGNVTASGTSFEASLAGSGTITGNVSSTATTNTIKLENNSMIGGKVTTGGNTNTITGLGSSKISGGVVNTQGKLSVELSNSAMIQNGITSSGTEAIISLKDSSILSGNSKLSNTTSKVSLSNSSKIQGNTTFAGTTNQLNAQEGSNMTGQIIAQSGTTTIGFGGNSFLSGGINTQGGTTTATFSENAKIQNGTSNFGANTTLIFKDHAQANNENFNITAGTTNIAFDNNAQMIGGSINTQGGKSNIAFSNDSKMQNGTISVSGGEMKLDAKDNATLQGQITQSGGTSDIDFSNQATFTGNITQSNGTSDIHFKNNSSMKGNITVTNGETQITFNDSAKIVGDVNASGRNNTVTFTPGTLLDGNLQYDSIAGAVGGGKSTISFTGSKITGHIQGYDEAEVKLSQTQVDGYFKQSSEHLKATITESLISGGFVGEGGSNNEVEMTQSKITNGVQQNTGKLDLVAKNSIITGGFIGTNSDNTIETINGSISEGVKQSSGSLKMINTNTQITGGFSGTNNSINQVTMTNGSLEGGIVQNTGKLDFLSYGTNISGGFTGTNSTNTLQVANGNFNQGDITQTQGALSGELVNVENLKNFSGTNSTNIIHLVATQIKNVTQSGGTLEFQTNSLVDGNIRGENGSDNKITVVGANVNGQITQSRGGMRLDLTNVTVSGLVKSDNAKFGLYSENTTLKQNLELIASNSEGASNALTLEGMFKQEGGTSNLSFANSTFKGLTSLKNTENANLIFTQSQIVNVEAQEGKTAINLTESKMQNFSGTFGSHSLILLKSQAQDLTQNGGRLSVGATANSVINSITGTNFSNLVLSLGNSEVKTNVSNEGNTTISMQDSKIGGDVIQTEGDMNLSAINSSIEGKYQQTRGRFNPISLTNSSIKSGMILDSVQEGTLTLNSQSSIQQGLRSTQSYLNFTLLNESFISGDGATKGITQEGGEILGTLNQKAEIRDGISLSNGATNLSLYNKSKISGGISAQNNETTILVDDSEIDGNITVNGKFLHLTAQNHSVIKSPQMQVTDADLKLIVDTNSQFIGDLTQTNHKQEVIIKQDSTFQGSITNTNTVGSITIQQATLTGNITQTGGTLGFDLSNKGIVGGNVTLNNVDATLSGSGVGNQIGGNFAQNGGNLNGSMNGLTLKGTYTQMGGISNATFTNSSFEGDTTITNAISSSLVFENSTLKNYTISGGDDNTLKLLAGTIMTGDLTLKDAAHALLKMDASTIDGNIQGSGDSVLRLDTLNSTITGNITFDTGGIKGKTDSTKIGGDILLTNTNSDVSFANESVISGNLVANNGENTIKFNHSQIKGNIQATGGKINLDLSNTSKVGGNIEFVDTTAHLTGSPENNEIMGNFTTRGTDAGSVSILTGEISSLTLHGTFDQHFGQSNILFQDHSLFEGKVTITEANSSFLKFAQNSGIQNQVKIIGGPDNTISLTQQSFIKGNIFTENKSTTSLIGENQSLIEGDLSATNATKTSISLSSSSFRGNITQTEGEFLLNASVSQITSATGENPFGITFSNVSSTINLAQNSALTSSIKADHSSLVATLTQSTINAPDAIHSAKLTDSDLSITASQSFVGLNLSQTAQPNQEKSLTLQFEAQSTFRGEMELKNIKSSLFFEESRLISNKISASGGSFDLVFDHAEHDTHREEDPEVIRSLELNSILAKIVAKNSSHAQITKGDFSKVELSVQAQSQSRLEGVDIQLKEGTQATYQATGNGNLNFNTTLVDTASRLNVELNGGVLQGVILQDHFTSGEVKLRESGDFGGRWAVTGDSKVVKLDIQNSEDALISQAIFSPVLKSPLSVVDLTMNFGDHETSSRVRKELVKKPDPLEDGTIPPPPDHQTYVRELHIQNLVGNHGLFRVYVDLGTNLADYILAENASGEHAIQVSYRSDTFKIGSPDERIVLAKVNDANTQVSFIGTQTEVGLTRYDTEILKENAQTGTGFEWILGQTTPAGMSYSSKIIASILQSQYRIFAVETDSLDRRLGGLENIQRDQGFWVRSFIGQASKDANDYSTSAVDKYYSIWSGFDYNAIGLTGHNFLGAFFNFTGMNMESKDYLGNASSFALGIYNVFKAHSGFYFDLLAKYIYTSSEFAISNFALKHNEPKFKNHKFLANLELGYTFYLGQKRKSSYIEPQFQITSGYIQGIQTDFIDVSGETIHATLGHNAPAMMRLGVFYGKAFGEKIRSNLKVGTSLAYDVNSGGELNFSDQSTTFKTKQKGDFRLMLSAYADVKFADNFRMYSAFDTSFFGSYNTVFNVNLGLRFAFGRRNNIVSEVPMVYNPYDPAPQPIDDRRTVPVIRNFTTKDIDMNYQGKRRDVPTYTRGNLNGSVNGYAPQPMMRKNFRDQAIELNQNNGGNQ
ncbi:hypothetical protein [Helicobacter kayseriensis]|uniref:hypothetical protein n=1 Tax=Helicobacter kayseriensis TaxID=2905877 RepID=UPI001E395EF0|nr:hypothetical protein [Helicobacter kayseriensis]MCE3047383.1 hypothetical protein [Helicobacter kayseriensis]MCE3048754.1 hypothetical protein [Helicobacter kayseriensis]